MSKNSSHTKNALWIAAIFAIVVLGTVSLLLYNGIVPSKISFSSNKDGTTFNWVTAEEKDRVDELNNAFAVKETRLLAWSLLSNKYSDDLRRQQWISLSIQADFRDKDASAVEDLLRNHALASSLRGIYDKGHPPFHTRGRDIRVTVPQSNIAHHNAHVHIDNPFANHSIELVVGDTQLSFYAKPDASIQDINLVQITSEKAADLFGTVDASEFSARIQLQLDT